MRARFYRERAVLSRRIAFRASIGLSGPVSVCCCLLYIEHLQNRKLMEKEERSWYKRQLEATESAEERNAQDGLH